MDKKKKLQEVFNGELDESVLYGLFLIVDSMPRKHMEIELIKEFLAYYYQSRGMVLGTVYSASELDKSEIVSLERAFSYKILRNVRLENKVDPKLIGGVKVVIDDSVWDGTYKTKMDDLRASLLKQEVEDESKIGEEIIEDFLNGKVSW